MVLLPSWWPCGTTGNYHCCCSVADLIPAGNTIEDSSCLDMKVEHEELSVHDGGSPGSPLADDDDAASDGVTDKSSLDEGDKKDGSGKKRKRRVRVNIYKIISITIIIFST